MPRLGSVAGRYAPAAGMLPIVWNDATGGTITTDTNYNGTGQTWKIHTFTTSGTFTPSKAGQTFTAALGGGGGGSGQTAQGNLGGRGGHGIGATWTGLLTAQAYTVTVGGGGGGAGVDPWGWGNGGGGGTSSLGSVVSAGGGGGGIGPGDQNHPVYPSIGSPDGPRQTYTTSGASVTYGGLGANCPGGYNDAGAAGAAGSVVVAYRIG